MSKQPSNVTTTSTQQAPEWARPYQQSTFNDLRNAINGQSAEDQVSPYGTVTPQNQAQLTAYNMGIGRALSGSPIETGAQQFAYEQMSGNNMNPYATEANIYMGQNPYLEQMISKSNNSIADSFARGKAAQTDSQFARAGTYGGSAWNEIRRNNESDLFGMLQSNTNDLYSKQYDRSAGLMENALNRATQGYESAQGRGMQATGMAQQLAGMDYNNIDRMSQYGNQQFQYDQSLLDSLNDDYFRSVNFPLRQGDQMLDALNRSIGNSGSAISTQSGGGQSRGQQALGGLMGMASMFM
jgi:hypothetical protein